MFILYMFLIFSGQHEKMTRTLLQKNVQVPEFKNKQQVPLLILR